MSALVLIVVVGLVVADGVQRGDMPLGVALAMFAGTMLLIGGVWAAGVIVDYRERKRLNRDAFVRDVMAAYQRQREAREACERA